MAEVTVGMYELSQALHLSTGLCRVPKAGIDLHAVSVQNCEKHSSWGQRILKIGLKKKKYYSWFLVVPERLSYQPLEIWRETRACFQSSRPCLLSRPPSAGFERAVDACPSPPGGDRSACPRAPPTRAAAAVTPRGPQHTPLTALCAVFAVSVLGLPPGDTIVSLRTGTSPFPSPNVTRSAPGT